MAVPQMPMRWMWRAMRHFFTAGSRMRSWALSPTVSFGFDAEGERDIVARDVAAAQADGDGAVEVHRKTR
jgi:hypothetical protein